MSDEPAQPLAGEGFIFQEGRITLPKGFEDRSANVFVPGDPQTQPNLSIARDRMDAGEELAAYIDRQIVQLKGRLAAYRFTGRWSECLGSGDTALVGEGIDASYKTGAQTIYQRQAAFVIAPQRALIFSAASAHPFNAKFETLWAGWLKSYAPPAAPPMAPIGPQGDADPASAA